MKWRDGKGRDDERSSVLGLGAPSTGSKLSQWCPSKAGKIHAQPSLPQPEKPASDQNASAQSGAAVQSDSAVNPESSVPRDAGDSVRANSEISWRPSEAVKERLSSLAPVRRRTRFALPRSMRLVASAVLFLIGIYAFVKLWTIPTGMDLHPALAVFGIALVLLLIAAIVNVVHRRHRAREDEKSTLRL